MYNNGLKRRCLCDMSLEEQDDFWQDIVNTKEGRVKLIKIGMTPKEIERLYINCNKFKLINTPILDDGFKLKI